MKKFLLLLIAVSFASCVEDPNNVPCFGCGNVTDQLKSYKIEIKGDSDSQNPLQILYYRDDIHGILSSISVNTQTNTNILETSNLSSFNQLGFKFSVGNGGHADIDTVIITDLESNQIIFENHTLNVTPGKIFMYVISTDSYTITN